MHAAGADCIQGVCPLAPLGFASIRYTITMKI